jgi:hypothetical protein
VKRVILFALVLSGCSTAVTPFFGGSQHGPYVNQFNGQILCSYISGWSPEPESSVCMCTLTDPYFSVDKTFLRAPVDALCDKDLNLK